jgi:multidrug efflux pump subunit AcrA (membrane-fusion protein)
MIRKLVVPILAVLGVVVAIITVVKGNRPAPASQPVSDPARAPFASYIAGAGIVEASTENIQVGTIVSGVVTEVYAKVHDQVNKGDPLFKIDDRDQQAELQVRQATLASANAKLQKVLQSPRPEDVPVYESKLHAAQAALADAQAQWKLYEDIGDERAVSRDEMNKRRFAVQLQDANVRQAQADLDELKAGAWKPDIEIARADVVSAEAQIKSTQTEIDRRTVRALVDGEILQVNIRPGEFAFAGTTASPLMMLGNTRTLHVRVDIDENDVWRFRTDRPAAAYVRGNPQFKTPVTFVRTEPYVLPKKSLTGDSTERVDTRVLQVLYSFPNGALPVFVGQQLDVFIEAPPVSGKSETRPDAPPLGPAHE